jgi:hypothetical protein
MSSGKGIGFLQTHPPVSKHGNGKSSICTSIDDFTIETSTYRGFPIGMFDYWRAFFAYLHDF